MSVTSNDGMALFDAFFGTMPLDFSIGFFVEFLLLVSSGPTNPQTRIKNIFAKCKFPLLLTLCTPITYNEDFWSETNC